LRDLDKSLLIINDVDLGQRVGKGRYFAFSGSMGTMGAAGSRDVKLRMGLVRIELERLRAAGIINK